MNVLGKNQGWKEDHSPSARAQAGAPATSLSRHLLLSSSCLRPPLSIFPPSFACRSFLSLRVLNGQYAITDVGTQLYTQMEGAMLSPLFLFFFSFFCLSFCRRAPLMLRQAPKALSVLKRRGRPALIAFLLTRGVKQLADQTKGFKTLCFESIVSGSLSCIEALWNGTKDY